jgi:hypothetical protein
VPVTGDDRAGGRSRTAGEDTRASAAIDNPDLFAVKRRLKAMNYNPGVLNGEWGGMTAGAIAGFINDRGGHIAAAGVARCVQPGARRAPRRAAARRG